MNERKQRLLSVVEVLASMVRTIQLRRTFSAVSPTPTLVMWRVIYGNLTDMARVLEWCKLFGSDDEHNQPVHWKNIASDPEQFRKDLFSKMRIYESKWRSYWTEMTAMSRSSCRASRSTAGGDQELSDIRPRLGVSLFLLRLRRRRITQERNRSTAQGFACIWCRVCGAVSRYCSGRHGRY